MLFIIFLIIFVLVQYKVNCDDNHMTVDVKKTDDIKGIYLNQMKFYPGNAVLIVIISILIKNNNLQIITNYT